MNNKGLKVEIWVGPHAPKFYQTFIQENPHVKFINLMEFGAKLVFTYSI